MRARIATPAATISQADEAFLNHDARPPRPRATGSTARHAAERRPQARRDAPPQPAPPPTPPTAELAALAQVAASWKKPLLLAGGGVIASGAEAAFQLVAERLGAPVFHTLMGKCALSSEHRLKVGLPWSRATSDVSDMDRFFSPLFHEADGLLAVGCRFTQATTGSWGLKLRRVSSRSISTRPRLGRHYPVHLGIAADAGATLGAHVGAVAAAARVLPGLCRSRAARRGACRVSTWLVRCGRRCRATPSSWRTSPGSATSCLPNFPVYEPRTFLHPAGFVAMGFGIPAALGAKAALPDAPWSLSWATAAS